MEHLTVGGGLLAAGVGARTFVSRDESKRKMEKLIPAAMKRQATRRHVAHAAGRWAGRAATTVGLPLAAYGTYTSLRPKAMPARKLSYRSDVVSPLTGSLTYRSDAEKVHVGNIKRKVKEKAQEVHDKPFGKRDLTRAETSTLVHRKERGRKISTAAGVMGLTALSLRAPEAAKFAATKSPAIARRVGRIARHEPGATKASNALGIVSIGTGSAGSLNYAAQQKLEAQQVKKGLPRALRSGKVRNAYAFSRTQAHVSGRVAGAFPNRDPRAIYQSLWGEKNRILSRELSGQKRVKVPPVLPKQLELDFGKRDDRFLREHRDRISPEAEKGYQYLRRGRNDAAATSALFGGLAAANVGGALYSRRVHGQGKLGTGLALANGIAAAYTGITAADKGEKAYRWNSKMGRIKAKGTERAAEGVYGRGRVPMTPEVEKALFRRSGPSRFDRKVDRTMDAAASRAKDTGDHTIGEARRAAQATIGDAERSGMRLVNHASGKAGRLIALGSLGLTAATTTPVIANHAMKRRRRVEKALLMPRVRMASPLMRKPALKASYVGTSSAGRKFTVRGSVR